MAVVDSTAKTAGHVGPGTATIPPGQGIYQSNATPTVRIGDRIQVGSRVFHYGRVIADTNRGVLVGPDLSVNGMVSSDGGVTAAAAGATSVTITEAVLSAITADAFAGGTLHTTDDAGEGYAYGIRSNTAAAANAVTLTLYDPLVEAITTATDAAIYGNPYNNLKIVDSTDVVPSGVLPITVDTSEESYVWIQTWGPCTVLDSGGLAAGEVLVTSSAGNAIVMSVFTAPIIGHCLQDGSASGGHATVWLQLAP